MNTEHSTAGSPDPAATLQWVALYMVTRQYGGPEEGGWWYDAGTLVTDVEIYRTAGTTPAAFLPDDVEGADALAARLNAAAEQMNFGRRPLHSVISTGIFEVHCIASEALPTSFPAARPVYA